VWVEFVELTLAPTIGTGAVDESHHGVAVGERLARERLRRAVDRDEALPNRLARPPEAPADPTPRVSVRPCEPYRAFLHPGQVLLQQLADGDEGDPWVWPECLVDVPLDLRRCRHAPIVTTGCYSGGPLTTHPR